MEESQPKIVQSCATFSGMEYALQAWADAFKSQTWENKAAFMVDNSDGPTTGGNLHYLHLIRAQDIPAVWQTVRFPFMWDTLELSWLYIIEHAHEIGAEFVFSCEADVVPPPEAMRLMYEASIEHSVGDKNAVVSQRYHPRAQDSPGFWWDTLGCTLFPTQPLYETRHLIHSIYELEVFINLQRLGYPRYRPGKEGPDLFIPDHLRDPNDPHENERGATAAQTRYTQRVIDGNKRKEKIAKGEVEPSYPGETQEEAVTRNPTRTSPLVDEEPEASFPFKMSPAVLNVQHGAVVGEAQPEIAVAEVPDGPDLDKAYPFDVSAPTNEEVEILLSQDRLRLNIGSDVCQIAGFKNVDFNPDVNPDYLTDATDLSMIETDSVDEILALHILEHLKFDDTLVALKEWMRVLKPMGMLTVACPDVVEVYTMMRHGATWGEYNLPIDETYVQATVFGANLLAEKLPEMRDLYGGPGHKHQSLFFQDMLLNRVLQAGFVMGHEVTGCFLRPCSIGEKMVQAFKPDQRYYDVFVNKESE